MDCQTTNETARVKFAGEDESEFSLAAIASLERDYVFVSSRHADRRLTLSEIALAAKGGSRERIIAIESRFAAMII